MYKITSICHLLVKRQMGDFIRSDFDDLKNRAKFLADTQIVENQHINHIRYITENERSSYVADSSEDGLAITSHTNRCVSIISTAVMEKVGEIKRNKRTIWTFGFHPYDSSLIAMGSLDGNVSIYKNFKLHRSYDNNFFLPVGTITSISFHPTLDIVCYAIHHKIFLWFWDQDIKHSLNADKSLKIKFAKFNPVNKMLITGILDENRQKLDYNLEHWINNNSKLSATYFLIELFDIFNLILDSIEFVDYINLVNRWNETFLKIVRFANELQTSKVILLKQNAESPINYLQDFGMSLTIFKRKLDEIEQSIDDYDYILRSLTLPSIDAEIAALRIISNRYFIETKFLPNRSDIKQDLLEEVFRKIDNIVILQTRDPSFYDNQRIYSEFSRSQSKLQAWEFDITNYPDLKQTWRNAITYCSLHNDSTVDITRDGTLIISFRELANGCYLIAAHSLQKSNLGEVIYKHKIDKITNIMSVSMSPSMKYILVGVRSDHVYGYFLQINQNKKISQFELYDNDNDCNDFISYLKWMSRPGDGIIIGYSSFFLRFIRHF